MPIYNNRDYIKLVRPLPDFVERDILDIPYIENQEIDISDLNNGKWLINLKNVSEKDLNPDKKIVHSFCYDDDLLRFYNRPIDYLRKVSPYYAVSSMDFSMDKKMDFHQIYTATYSNRWSGAYVQTNGKISIPCVGWVEKNTYDICFAGLRDGGIFIISTLGANNDESYSDFMDGYYELRNRFPLATLICVGDKLSGMDSDVCYILYEESFGNWDRKYNYWQPKLFNWDLSIAGKAKGV